MSQAALLNHLWQTTAFVLAAAVLAWALRRHQARVRFWIWAAASLKFLIPFSLLVDLGRRLPWHMPAAAPAPALRAWSAPFTPALAPLHAITYEYDYGASAAVAGHSYFFWFLVASGAVSLALLVRWALAWRRLARIAGEAKPAHRGGLRLAVTRAAIEPGVFGIFRPVILLPRGIEQRLSPAQIEAVLAHERCHIRRRDNLWSALHMLVECLFWFHPLVWLIGARMVAERERACDEAVLRSGGEREAYARGLIEVGRFYTGTQLSCATGITGGGLTQRVHEVMSGKWGRNLSRGKKLLLGGLALAVLLGPLVAGFLLAQSAPMQFDAASITPASNNGGEMRNVFMGLRVLPTRLIAQNMTLKDLIVAAYNFKPYQVVGPRWMSSDQQRYNITAEVQKPLPYDEMKSMLVPFLRQQFGLKTHNESKVESVYFLRVSHGGPKLKPATALPAGPAHTPNRVIQRADMGGKPGHIMVMFSPRGAKLKGISNMAGIVGVIARTLNRPIIDQTGLKGTYDYTLNFMPDFRGMRMRGMMPMGPPPGGGGKEMGGGAVMGGGRQGTGGQTRVNGQPMPGMPETGALAAPAPTIFTALKEQLGLKLVSGKGPVELLVVDHANKAPLGN